MTRARVTGLAIVVWQDASTSLRCASFSEAQRGSFGIVRSPSPEMYNPEQVESGTCFCVACGRKPFGVFVTGPLARQGRITNWATPRGLTVWLVADEDLWRRPFHRE
ncbi:hypothetical protein EV126DRAFT_406833 [Verticillium dahliae]|nr:hypothetical protein EV126DRAFT_406833 [Verticillium dahliae]